MQLGRCKSLVVEIQILDSWLKNSYNKVFNIYVICIEYLSLTDIENFRDFYSRYL